MIVFSGKMIYKGGIEMAVYIQRIYSASTYKGVRVLVDRLWPRGISKEEAQVDVWLKNIGPSASLRKWFNHDVDKFESFKAKYMKELTNNTDQNHAFEELKSIINHTEADIYLLYSAKDTKHNQAVVLKSLLT